MSEAITLWRISNYKTLDGAGGLQVAGRWHSKGRAVFYASEDPSTALLEILVHFEIDSEDRPATFQALKIESEGSVSLERASLEGWPQDWPTDLQHTRAVGDEWLRSGRTLLLEVPSVLVPERRNYLVNPAHAEISQLRIVAIYHHPLDARFMR